MKKKKKVIRWIIVVLLISACAVAGWKYATQPLAVTVYPVSARDVENTVTEEGIVSAETEVEVYPQIAGTVKEVYVKEGDQILAGDPLFTIDISDLESQLKQISSNVISAQAQVQAQNGVIEQAQIHYDYTLLQLQNTQSLYDAGISSKSQLDEVQYAADTAKATLDTAISTQNYYETLVGVNSAQALSIKNNIAKATIAAPSDGVIMEMDAETGKYLSPQSLSVLIYSGENFTVKTHLRTQDAAQLNVGNKAILTLSLNTGDLTTDAEIIKISNKAEQMQSVLGVSERRVTVTLSLKKEDLPVWYGYNLDVKFTTGMVAHALPVPKTAVFPKDGGYAVWVSENNIASVRTVETGLKTETEIVITSGILENDLVILDPPSSIKEGMLLSY